MNTHTKLCVAVSKVQSAIFDEKILYVSNLVNDFAGKKNAKIYKYMKNITHSSSFPFEMSI